MRGYFVASVVNGDMLGDNIDVLWFRNRSELECSLGLPAVFSIHAPEVRGA